MTISVAVTLNCDRRPATGCAWSYDLGADPDPAAVAVKRREAAELGWTTVRINGALMYLCPVCNDARLAGVDVRPRPTAPATLPKNIGEASERSRRRRTQQTGG